MRSKREAWRRGYSSGSMGLLLRAPDGEKQSKSSRASHVKPKRQRPEPEVNAQRAMEQEAGVGAGTKGPADALQGLPDDKGKEPADEALGASEWSGDEARR